MNLKKGGLKDFLPGLEGRDIRWLPRMPSGLYVGKPFAADNDHLYAVF
jgi:hypothetical protein